MNRQEELNQILEKIVPINVTALEEGVKVCDRLAKPLGALGKMEKMYADADGDALCTCACRAKAIQCSNSRLY